MINTADHNGNLQSAINAALHDNDDVYAQTGKIAPLTEPVMIARYDDEQYKQVTLKIIGDATMWDQAKRSVIRATFSDAPVINVQEGKGVHFEGLHVVAPSDGIDSRYALQACFSIDSVCGRLPIDGGFPLLLPWYKGTMSRGGSTGTTIKNCTTNGANAGIVTSINGLTQNGDLLRVENHRFMHNKYGVVGCQQQEKGNRLINLNCWTKMQYLLMFNKYGEGKAGEYVLRDSVLAAAVDNIVHRESGGGFPLHVYNVQAESLLSIGRWHTNVEDTFNESTVNFRHPTAGGYFPDYHFQGSNMKFNNVNLRYYGYPLLPLLLTGENNVYNNCKFGSYANPVKGAYYTTSSKDFQKGFTVNHVVRTTLEVVNNTAVVITNLLSEGQVVIFTRMGDGAFVGMGQVDNFSGHAATLKYLSPGIKTGVTYNIGTYQSILNTNV